MATVESVERADELEPADEPLLGALLGVGGAADRTALEANVELEPERRLVGGLFVGKHGVQATGGAALAASVSSPRCLP